MAHVGQGTTHKGQLDELDAEIAEMEAAVKGETQQPEATPEQVAQQQPPAPEQGEQQYEEVITSVEEFEKAAAQPQEPASQEQAAQPEQLPLPTEQQPGQPAEPQPTGRRSWKTDYLELENRYKLLRQAGDRHKFETKQQMAGFQEALLRSQEESEQLRTMITQLQQNTPQANPFSQEDIDVLGEGTVNSMNTAIHSAVDGATKPLQAELLAMKKAERDRLRGAAENNRSQAYNSFTGKLAELVPDYPSINVDKGFIKWLRDISPYSGAQRLTHFHQAEQAGDVERVAQFFVEYKQLLAAPQQLLEQSVTPTGQGGGGAAPPTNQPKQDEKLYSMAFINKFYDDDIAGLYKGKEALRDKLDAEIDLALTQGRVR